MVEHRVIGGFLEGQFCAGVEVDGVGRTCTCVARQRGVHHTSGQIRPCKRGMASIRGVEVVKQISAGRWVISRSDHAVVNGFERQADGCNPHRVSCCRDVFCIPRVPFRKTLLHVGEILVDVGILVPLAARFSASTAPRHEENNLSTLCFDFVAQVHRGVLALLPVRVVGGERRYLALVLKNNIIPR